MTVRHVVHKKVKTAKKAHKAIHHTRAKKGKH